MTACKDNIERFINDHMGEKITLGMLAGNVFLSAYHFSREFKKETGTSPKEFVLQIKLKRAEELLCMTELKVCEISEQIGYEPGRFSSLFKERYGCSPIEYRQHFRMMPGGRLILRRPERSGDQHTLLPGR